MLCEWRDRYVGIMAQCFVWWWVIYAIDICSIERIMWINIIWALPFYHMEGEQWIWCLFTMRTLCLALEIYISNISSSFYCNIKLHILYFPEWALINVKVLCPPSDHLRFILLRADLENNHFWPRAHSWLSSHLRAGVRYNLHPRNMSTPRVKIWMRNIHPYHKISTPGVIISNHEIFTHLHRGEYIMHQIFTSLLGDRNIIVSNINPPPLGENFIVSNIYSSPGVRILYHKILTPSLGWEYYIIKYSLLYMGW